MRFEADYDALWQSVEIDGRRYSVSNGNVFVVRLAEGSRPSVSQIDTTLTDLHDVEALEGAVMAKLPADDPAQRTLRGLYSRDDCESRKPPLPAGRSEKKS